MQKFATTGPVSVVLDVPAGRIRFVAADQDGAVVEVAPADAGKSRDVKTAEATTVDYRDGILRIETAEAKNRLVGATGSLEVTVQLPAGSRIQAKTASAELHSTGRLGDVTYESAHGTISLDETAAARLTLQAGDISVTRLGGSAQISTQKGDITITEAVTGTVTLRTEAGNLHIGAAPGTSASLDAGTGHGRIHNSLQNAGNTPALNIQATTAYGDITARTL
ncbi:DUF4097 family beta strand repeat-containing protein [Streptomyces sp. NPDC097981]|uniref:DUF4097 family beta strand repeat-containing protein n=1 Tax=Streptomyces sp. NPDC097981 TaxID=3155428 RepID=UPI00332F49DE